MKKSLKFMHHSRQSGFTLVELIITVGVFSLLLTSVFVCMQNLMRRDHELNNRMAMVTDGQRLASFLRTTTRLSRITEMAMYPQVSPHIAISYPVPEKKDEDGNVMLTAEGHLVWGQTLIVHSWPPDNPTELRLTRFRPRDNSLSTPQREQQLEDVTLNGNGGNTFNGLNSETRTLANLKPEFTFRPDGGIYNFYAPEPRRDLNVVMGGVRLQPGANIINFKTTSKTPASGSYGLKIDMLHLSPAGLAMEAEGLLPVISESGATSQTEEKTVSNWSDRQLLFFPAQSPGAELSVTFFNDTWFETLFLGGGSDLEDCVTHMSTEEGDVGTRLRPSGREPAWFANYQTRSDGEGLDNDMAFGTVMRVVLRGAKAENGQFILQEGDGCTVTFRASDQEGKSLRITNAFISEALDEDDPGPNVVWYTTTRLQFGTPDSPQNGINIGSGEFAETVPADFPIDPDKSYVVTFQIDDAAPAQGNPWHWHLEGGSTDTFLLPESSNPGGLDLVSPYWSGRSDLQNVPGVVGVSSVETTYADKGVYTSRIVDTTLAGPTYHDLNWDGVFPDNTVIGFQVRTGNQPNLSDAGDWENIQSMYNPGQLSAGSGRYVQVRITLFRDKVRDEVPELRNFTLRWWGDPAYVDFGGDFYQYPSGGVVEVLVNETPPVSTLRAELRLTSDDKTEEDHADSWKLTVESTPRN